MKARICGLQLPNKFKMNIQGEGYAEDSKYVDKVLARTKLTKKNGWKCVKSSKHVSEYVALIPCGFDIETTTINGHGYMYIWQMCFGDFIIYGRTWESWFEFMEKVQKWYDLGITHTDTHTTKKYIMVWIANEGFEFQFFGRKAYAGKPIVREVFADGTRSPLTCKLDFTGMPEQFGFIVRDALRVGSLSLASLADDYCTTKKAVGDLDYSVLRNKYTKLTPKELGYCRNDVVILHEWAMWFFEAYVKPVGFNPMTKTGIIRQAVKQEFTIENATNPTLGWLIRSLFPSFDEYQHTITWLYRGGFTHANWLNTNTLIEGVEGFDFTSSYPAVMLQETYPMTKFVRADDCDIFTPYNESHLSKYDGEAWYADFHFTGLRPKTSHSVEQIYKIHEFAECGENYAKTVEHCSILPDNGRILAAAFMTVTLNELDFDVYRDFYEWDDVEITNFWHAKKGYLPQYIQTVVKYFYKQKSQLKKQGLDDTAAYVVAKQMVNGLYGLTVQKIHFDEVSFDENDGWRHYKPDFDNVDEAKQAELDYEEEIGDTEYMLKHGMPRRALSPFWGIWVTSHARRRLLKAVRYVNEDAIYCDTDSVYIRNPDKYRAYFDTWNDAITKLNQQLFGSDFADLGDLGTFDPVEIKGKDYNGNKVKSRVYSFKTLGAKRYIKFDEFDNVETTIAGLPKKALKEKAVCTYHDIPHTQAADYIDSTPKDYIRDFIVEEFSDGMSLDSFDSLKKRAKYNDEWHSDTVIDPDGNVDNMAEDSSMCIVETDFHMSLEEFYKELVTIYREEHDRF